MTWLRFALRRQLTPPFAALLLAGMLLLMGAGFADLAVELRPCGLLNEDGSEASESVCAALLQQGFQPCADRQTLINQVRAGELDCGIVLLDGLQTKITDGSLDGAALTVSSPMSFLTEVYQARVMAELFKAASPAFTLSVTQALGWDTELSDISTRFERYYEEGLLFTFEVETVDGAEVRGSGYGDSILLSAVAIGLFAAVIPAICLSEGKSREVCRRIGGRSLWLVRLPAAVAIGLLCYLAAAIPLMIFTPAAALSALGYCFVLISLGLVLSRVLRAESVCVLLPLWLLSSLALCPIFTDLTKSLPAAAYLRLLLPPCWFFPTAEQPLIWLTAGALSLPAAASAAALIYGGKKLLKRRIR